MYESTNYNSSSWDNISTYSTATVLDPQWLNNLSSEYVYKAKDCMNNDLEVGDHVLYTKGQDPNLVEGNIDRFTDRGVIMNDGYWISINKYDKIYKL